MQAEESAGTIRRVRVAALLFALQFAFDRPGAAGSAKHFLSLIKERLQLIIADAEILNGHAFRDEVFTVTLLVMAAQIQLHRIDTEMHA